MTRTRTTANFVIRGRSPIAAELVAAFLQRLAPGAVIQKQPLPSAPPHLIEFTGSDPETSVLLSFGADVPTAYSGGPTPVAILSAFSTVQAFS